MATGMSRGRKPMDKTLPNACGTYCLIPRGLRSTHECCNVAIGWEGCLANGGRQGPIYGRNRQRTASNRLLESHRKQSSNGLQQRDQAEEVKRTMYRPVSEILAARAEA